MGGLVARGKAHADGPFDIAAHDIMTLAGAVIERGKHRSRAGAGLFRSPDRHAVAARGEIDAELALDESQMLVMLAEDGSKQAIVVEGEGEKVLIIGIAPGLGAGKLVQADSGIQRAAAPSVATLCR